MNNLEDQELLEVSNEYFAKVKEALNRLYTNKDFQTVILNGYFSNEPIRITSILADDGVIRRGERSDLMEQLVAISRLQDYFKTIVNLGPPTIEELEADEEE